MYYYDEQNDAPGMKGLVLGCLLCAGMVVVAVGTVLLLVLPH